MRKTIRCETDWQCVPSLTVVENWSQSWAAKGLLSALMTMKTHFIIIFDVKYGFETIFVYKSNIFITIWPTIAMIATIQMIRRFTAWIAKSLQSKERVLEGWDSRVETRGTHRVSLYDSMTLWLSLHHCSTEHRFTELLNDSRGLSLRTPLIP